MLRTSNGVVNLKLEAEAFFVKSTTFTKENILDKICTDTMNCALLNKAAMDFMVKNKNDIISNVSSSSMMID